MPNTYMGSYGTLEWAQDFKDRVENLEKEGDWVTYVTTLPTNTTVLAALLASIPENGLVVEG